MKYTLTINEHISGRNPLISMIMIVFRSGRISSVYIVSKWVGHTVVHFECCSVVIGNDGVLEC